MPLPVPASPAERTFLAVFRSHPECRRDKPASPCRPGGSLGAQTPRGDSRGTCPPCHTRQDTPCERGKHQDERLAPPGRAVLILQGTHSFPLSSPQAADAVFEAWTASYFPGKTLQGAFPGRLLPCLKASLMESHPGSAPTISLCLSAAKLPLIPSAQILNFHGIPAQRL